jgi:hypothetical protein
MDEKLFLDSYNEESVEELIALERDYRLDSIVSAFEQAVERKAEKFGYDKLSHLEKAVLAIESLEREVNNGGFDQFFVNSSGKFTGDLVSSLKLIECFAAAEIVSRAMSALNVEGELTYQNIQNAIFRENQMRDQIFGVCDNDFYEYPDDITGKLFDFIKKHPDSISL